MQSIFIRSNFPNIVTQKQETRSKTTLVVPSCVECFMPLFPPKGRNAEKSNMFHDHPCSVIMSRMFYPAFLPKCRNAKRATCSTTTLVVSSCVECFMLLFLPKCRNAEKSNIFRSKPTVGSVCGGICCSVPFLYLTPLQNRIKQNSIKNETLDFLLF